MASVRVTRGRLTALWLVLRTLEKLGGQAAASEVQVYARRSALRGGGLPIIDGVRLACEGRFMIERMGVFTLEPLGHRALRLADDDEPPAPVLRLFVSVLLLAEPPTWVAWWQGAPHDLEDVVPDGEKQVMRDVGLLPPPVQTDPAGWAWWQALNQVPLPEQTAVRRKHIGDAGEQLTVSFEQRRLTQEGYAELAAQVRWVAQESDAYGFDVLSFAGSSQGELQPEDPVAIEVKSTSLPVVKVFPLYLTAHEWRTAEGLGHRYRMHLWASVDPGPPARSRQGEPIVLQGGELAGHLPGPAPCAEDCAWQTARIHMRLA
jgi:Domain of unknown function (DUF3883)